MMRRNLVFVLFGTFLASTLLAPLASAQELTLDDGFDPNYVLADDDIFNVNGMTYDRLVTFMRSKGVLGDLQLTDIDGQKKPAAQIIWRVATSYKINPKYLLALIQKEQSLVESDNPTQGQLDWAAGYGVCDSCAKNDPAIQNFKGFASQLEWAAKQHREKYLLQLLGRGYTIGGQSAGKTVTIDGRRVTPVNNATAMLYTYTPHIHGNLNLWRIWQRWFKLKFPDGTVVRAEPSHAVYLIRFGEKRPFASETVVMSMVDTKKIVSAKDDDLRNYPVGASIKFPPYAILQDEKDAIYLLTSSDTMRRIANKRVFDYFGFNEDEIVPVKHEELAAYTETAPITEKTTFPQGALVKLKTDPNIWYVEDGIRHALVDKSLVALYFQGRRIRTVTPAGLKKYTLGEPYHLRDGELVRSTAQPDVYVVENGLLRPIPTADVFENIGWNWKNVVTVSPKLLALHRTGDPITVSSNATTTTAPLSLTSL